MPLLECKKVSKYFGGLAAVSNVDLYVDRGEIVGLIGPNGAGKTTLFNLISGAIPLSSGEILFKDKKINGLPPNKICRLGIARTFQLVKIFGNMTVLQNVILGALFGKSDNTTGSRAEEKAKELLDFMELYEFKDRMARDLTLVNQKKLEVARALATGPELLLLDELMAGLNPSEVLYSIEIVRRISKTGVTILMIEHVMSAIMNTCGRIAVLHHGEKIAEGTPQEIATNARVIEVYFGEETDAGNRLH